MAPEAVCALPSVEWRRFSSQGPVRQWIALPSFDTVLAGANRHLRRRLLVEFSAAGVWLFECALDFRWSEDVLACTAAILSRHLNRLHAFPRLLQRELAEVIDTVFTVSRPALGEGGESFWNTRALAVHHVLQLALADQAVAGSAMAGAEDRSACATRLQQQVESELARASALFRSHLDPTGVSLCSSGKQLCLDDYNRWAMLDAQRQRNRGQFAETFPMFRLGLRTSETGFPPGLPQAVDRGVPMVDYLARAYCVRKGTVRWLVGKRPEDLGAHWLRRPARLLALLDALPVEYRPAAKADWDHVNQLIETAERDTLRPVSAAIVALWMREWRLASCARRNADHGHADWIAGVRELSELWAALDDCLRVRSATTHRREPALGHQQLRALADSTLSGRSWRSALELARRWRSARRAAVGQLAAARDELTGKGFPALLPGEWLVGERLLVPLTTREALEREGRSLQHCVAAYAGDCASGESLIVSLRDFTSRRRCSTAEFTISQPRPGPVHLDLRQHRAHGNSTPGPACTAAVSSLLLRAPADPLLQAHWKASLQRRAIRQGMSASSAARLAGILAHEEAFRQVLPAAQGYDALLTASGPAVRAPASCA